MKTALACIMMNTMALGLCHAQLVTPPPPAGKSFETTVNEGLTSFKPLDIFGGDIPECVLQSKGLGDLEAAIEAIQPCLRIISARYKTLVFAMSQKVLPVLPAFSSPEYGQNCYEDNQNWTPVCTPHGQHQRYVRKPIERIEIFIPSDLPLTHPLRRDLEHSLRLRGHKLLNFTTTVYPMRISLAQQSINKCADLLKQPNIYWAPDFIEVYGHCILEDPELHVTKIEPLLSAPLEEKAFSIVLTTSDDSIVTKLGGLIYVQGKDGPISFIVQVFASHPR